MASIYINLPNPHVTLHNDPACPFTKHKDTQKREISIETALQGIRLIRAIENKSIPFKAVAGLNGLWVYVRDEDALDVGEELAESMRPMRRTYGSTPPFPFGKCC